MAKCPDSQPLSEEDTSICSLPGGMDVEAENTVSYVLDVLKTITVAAQGLATSLPSMKIVLYRIEKEQEEMDDLAARQTQEVDLLVTVELSRLKLEFQSCTTKAKLFVYACVTMAKYGHSREIAKIIENEIEGGSISSLKEFIKDILKKLKLCSQRFKEFNSAHTLVTKKADRKMEEYKARAEGTRSPLEVCPREVASTGLQFASIVGIGAGLVLPNLGVLSPKMSAIAVCCGVVGLAGSAILKGYLSEVGHLREVHVQGHCEVQRKIFEDAQKCVVDLATSMDKVTHQITEIEAHTKQARDDIDGVNEKCLESQEGMNLTNYLKEAIKEHLRNFREALQAILDITGPDGAKISSEPEEFLRTTTEQPSEDKNATVDERNPMTLEKFTVDQSSRRISHSLDVKIPEKLSHRMAVPAQDNGGLHTEIETGMNLATTHTTDVDEYH